MPLVLLTTTLPNTVPKMKTTLINIMKNSKRCENLKINFNIINVNMLVIAEMLIFVKFANV